MHGKSYPKSHVLWLILGASGLLALLPGCSPPVGQSEPNQNPTANAGADITIDVGQRVTLNGSGSTDADDDPLTFSWDQRSGPAVTLVAANTDQPSFLPVEEGFYEFVVTVTDDRGGGFSKVAPRPLDWLCGFISKHLLILTGPDSHWALISLGS